MSFDAMKWVMDQAIEPALTKFCLLAMAECVNAEAGAMECWPSYAHLARRTGMNTKTVEVSVFRLKDLGYLVDTGRRAGDTSKVVVYRLNDPKTGGVKPGPHNPNANGTRPQNDPNSGVIGATGNPPKSDANPPKNDGQSPQKVEEIPPKTGDGIRKGTKNRTRKEPGIGVAAVAGVEPKLLADWMVVRKDKRAGTLTETAVQGLEREAAKAGLTNEEAVRYCIEANWISFNATFYANREKQARPTGGAVPNKQEALEASNRAIGERWMRNQENTFEAE